MKTKDLLKKVRKIEIKTRRLSDQLFSGQYHSAFKGRGMTFAEVRPYQYGDDVRRIDWNVTARHRTPFVKLFEEERELTVLLVVDISGSENFGTRHMLKREMITEIAATLAFSAIKNNDKVGLILHTDRIELFIPPKKGRSHVLNIIRQLLDFRPEGRGTSVSTALRFAFNVLKKTGIVFVISDFMDTGYADTLKILARKHDTIGIRVYDPAEADIPNLGFALLTDPETGRAAYVDTSSARVRAKVREHFRRFDDYFLNAFRRSGSGHIRIATGDSYVKALMNYFKTSVK